MTRSFLILLLALMALWAAGLAIAERPHTGEQNTADGTLPTPNPRASIEPMASTRADAPTSSEGTAIGVSSHGRDLRRPARLPLKEVAEPVQERPRTSAPPQGGVAGGGEICPPDGIDMGEPCGDDLFGGCNMDEPTFFEIKCGDTVCGTSWAHNANRDTDWLEIVVEEPTTFTFSGTAEFAFIIGLVNTGGSGDCADAITGLNPARYGAAGTTQSFTTTVDAGTYWFFIAHQELNGNPCGSGSNAYSVTLECGTPDAECGVPATGACCEANGSPFCEDPDCCAQICAEDPYCCEVEWDESCAEAAGDPLTGCASCTECGDPNTGACCEANVDSPFCEDPECCSQICDLDPYCCETNWDSQCAAAARELCVTCFDCGHPLSGSCCEANETHYCDHGPCCEQVCQIDPSCCNDEWHEGCAELANDPFIGCLSCLPLDCPDGASSEPEVCGEDTNGGCNAAFQDPPTTPIACGETICGTAWADDNFRDTDWYEVVVEPGESYEATFTAYAEFPVLIGLLADEGSPVCISDGLAPFATADAAEEVSITVTLTPGTWWFFIAPAVFEDHPCGIGTNEYWVSLSGCSNIEYCYADLTGDGTTDVFDLLDLLANWGPNPPASFPGTCEGACGGPALDDFCFCDETCCDFGDCCEDKFEVCGGCEAPQIERKADINNDWTVDVFDLLLVLADWGCAVEQYECPSGSTVIDIPCPEEPYGGCNLEVLGQEPAFYEATCGETVCGTAWSYNGWRSSTWLELAVEEETTVTMTATAQFPFLMGLVDTGGSGDCEDAAFIDPFLLGNPDSLQAITVTLQPGTHWFYMGSQIFYGNPCGLGANGFSVTLGCH